MPTAGPAGRAAVRGKNNRPDAPPFEEAATGQALCEMLPCWYSTIACGVIGFVQVAQTDWGDAFSEPIGTPPRFTITDNRRTARVPVKPTAHSRPVPARACPGSEQCT